MTWKEQLQIFEEIRSRMVHEITRHDSIEFWFWCAMEEKEASVRHEAEGQLDIAQSRKKVCGRLLALCARAIVHEDRWDMLLWMGRAASTPPKRWGGPVHVVGSCVLDYLNKNRALPTDHQLRQAVNKRVGKAGFCNSTYMDAKKTLGLTGDDPRLLLTPDEEFDVEEFLKKHPHLR